MPAGRSIGGTLNDVGLTVVTGALRALAERRGDSPRAPLKAMVPVSMRRANETGPGNGIAMVAIELPVHLGSPQERLRWVRARTRPLKGGGRAEGTHTLFRAGALVPPWLRSPVVRRMSSPRLFNLTVSQSPGPRDALYLLGCEMEEVYSVVPSADRHALAIGMVRYRRELFIGCYADPEALPEIRELPALPDAAMQQLAATPNAGRATAQASASASAPCCAAGRSESGHRAGDRPQQRRAAPDRRGHQRRVPRRHRRDLHAADGARRRRSITPVRASFPDVHMQRGRGARRCRCSRAASRSG